MQTLTKFETLSINHNLGLMTALSRKIESLRYEADYMDACKEGRSKLAVKYRDEADELAAQLLELTLFQ